MSYRSDRFNRAMRSLDHSCIDPSKDRSQNDNGLALGRMLDALDYDEAKEEARERAIRAIRDERLFVAEMRLVEAGLRHLVPVLLLIVDNGSDRAASLARVPRATYFRHRDALLDFFCP